MPKKLFNYKYDYNLPDVAFNLPTLQLQRPALPTAKPFRAELTHGAQRRANREAPPGLSLTL